MKKVKCIDNSSIFQVLTSNRIYDVVEEDAHSYWVITNKGIKDWFRKNRFIEIEEKVIPKLWCIKSNNEEEQKIIGEYANKIYSTSYYEQDAIESYYHFPKIGNICTSSSKYNGYEELSFEDFQTLILKQPNMKNIIGYKTPIDFKEWSIPKGTIFKRVDNAYNCELGGISGRMPKEIVETWEPIYEEKEEILNLGDKNIKITISKDKIEAEGKDISIVRFRKLYSCMIDWHKIQLNGWNIKFPKVLVGCSEFSYLDIDLIISTYDKLNK